MTSPVPEQALARLDLAFGTLQLPDWQAHASALADAIAALSDFYLHVDVTTGAYDPAPIYLDRSRVVFGLIPEAVAPLVRLLQRQTQMLDLALQNGWRLPPTEEPAWAHWHNRLGRYVSALERALVSPRIPSEALWRDVTAPLLQGLYPADFDVLGIANPGVASKPDAASVPTTAFMVALQTQETSRVQTWLLRWREDTGIWGHEMREMLRGWFEAAKLAVRQGVSTTAKVLVIGAAVGGLGWFTWKALRSTNERPRR